MKDSTDDTAHTFDRIMAAANALLKKHGAESLTVRKVAKAAGVSMGTLRYYFATKDEMLEACLDPYYERLHEIERTFSALLEGVDDHEKVVEMGVRAFYQFARNQPEDHRLRMLTVNDVGELDYRRRRAFRLPALSRFAKLMGKFSDRSPAELRLLLQSMTFVVARYALCPPEIVAEVVEEEDETLSQKMVEDHLVDVLLTMLRSTNATKG